MDLETIWTTVITEELKIDMKTLQKYRAVLIIPALYKRPLVKHLLTILLSNMGFGGAFVIQDHVAATFGAGVGEWTPQQSVCVSTRILKRDIPIMGDYLRIE